MKKLLMMAAATVVLSAPAVYAAKEGAHHEAFKAKFEQTLSKLPAEKAELVRTSFEANKTQSKAQWEQFRALHKEQKALLGAETFDKDAYLAKAKQIADLKHQMSLSRSESMANVAVKLTADERKILLDGMKRSYKGGKKPAAE